jgi:hypothetical protein
MRARSRAGAAGLPFLDEAAVVIEQRRWRRWFAERWRPVGFILVVIGIAWAAAPLAVWLLREGSPARSLERGWPFGLLMVGVLLGAATAAFLRASHFWRGERLQGTLAAWLLTRQEPRRVLRSTLLNATLFALLLAAAPGAMAAAVAIAVQAPVWASLESAAILVLGAALGAAAGSAAFFVQFRAAPRGLLSLSAAVLALVALLLWLRFEAVQGGWSRPWEEHPARFTRAASLLTPGPILLGISCPAWWEGYIAQPMGLPVRAWQAGLMYPAALALAMLVCYRLCSAALLILWADPERLESLPADGSPDAGGYYHWRGFRNPVWTREIRTRLRSRETTEFIFVASLAVAMGAFLPLLLAARDLADPLRTAEVARQVFYWLAMTLLGLVALVSPGMAADAFAAERSSGSLDMLLGTPMRPREILSGKVLGCVSMVSLLLSPSLPLFGLCYLFRGASGPQVVQIYGLLLVTTVVAAYLGVTASAMQANVVAAKGQAYVLTLLFVGVPGGAFATLAAIASPIAELRKALGAESSASLLILTIAMILLGLLAMNATERLRYADHS